MGIEDKQMEHSQIKVIKTNSCGSNVTYVVDRILIYPNKIRLLWLSGKHFDFPFEEISSFTFFCENYEDKKRE